MGDAFICRRGGGGVGTKGWITVNAPAGATVTITNVTVTMTAEEKNGQWVFLQLEKGTWEVSAERGGESTTATVTIDEYKGYAVTLSFFTAYLPVAYPAGAICTCSNGTVTMTAGDTSGSCTFTVPSAGEWTVTAAADGDKVSEKVLVGETNGATYEVTLSFALFIIKNGVEQIAMNCSTNLAKSTEEGLLVLKGTAYGYHYAQTAAVDLTDYKTFKVEGSSESGFDIAVWRIGKKPNNEVSNADAIVRMAKDETSKSLDISAISGGMLVGIFCSSKSAHKISNLYLSKS